MEGQPQTGKVYRIGVIVAADAAANTEGPNPRNQSVAALLRGLRDLGYVYGRDFVTEPRSAEGRTERSAALAEELARLNVDVIVVGGPAVSGVKEIQDAARLLKREVLSLEVRSAAKSRERFEPLRSGAQVPCNVQLPELLHE